MAECTVMTVKKGNRANQNAGCTTGRSGPRRTRSANPTLAGYLPAPTRRRKNILRNLEQLEPIPTAVEGNLEPETLPYSPFQSNNQENVFFGLNTQQSFVTSSFQTIPSYVAPFKTAGSNTPSPIESPERNDTKKVEGEAGEGIEEYGRASTINQGELEESTDSEDIPLNPIQRKRTGWLNLFSTLDRNKQQEATGSGREVEGSKGSQETSGDKSRTSFSETVRKGIQSLRTTLGQGRERFIKVLEKNDIKARENLNLNPRRTEYVVELVVIPEGLGLGDKTPQAP